MKQFSKYERKEVSNFEILPKGAYVVRILNAKEEPNANGNGSHLSIAFDIAEGEYAGFYKRQFDGNNNEDKHWSYDGVYRLNCPDDNSEQWIIDKFNQFMTIIEDCNSGYHWNWDESTLKDKIFGGKFANEQSAGQDGTVYDHTKLKWVCSTEVVRSGKFGKMPNDKLVTPSNNGGAVANSGFSTSAEEEIPF